VTNLPDGWAEATIGDVCIVNPPRDINLDMSDLVSFVPMPAVDEISGEIVRPVDRPLQQVIRGFTQFREGDVLFAKITPSMENGKSAVARKLTNGAGFGSTEFCVLRSNGDIEPDYLWRYIRQQEFRGNAKSVMTGAVGQLRVPSNYLKTHPIPLPPLPEQRRIVAKLDQLFARTARARVDLGRISILIAKYKEALLAAAFSGELTREWRQSNTQSGRPSINQGGIDGRADILDPLPECWIWTSIGRVALVTGGLTKNPTRNAVPTRAPYLRVANVYANELRLDDVAEIGCTAAELAKTELSFGDLLIVEGNGSLDQIGRVALWRDELKGCSHQNHLIRARLNEEVIPQFALYWLLSPGARSAIERVAATTSGLYTLSITKIQGLPIPVCNLEEQAEIVRIIEIASVWLDRLTVEHARTARLLPKLDRAILAKAFRGELVPQDPSDEPASELLARMRAARSDQPTRKRVRKPRTDVMSRAPRERAAMTKSRDDDDVRNKPYLADLLRKTTGPGGVEDLFKRADLTVADFYKQLKWEVDSGHIRDDDERLEAA
jgi:type I restriction enzyme, S subunit